MFRHAAGRKERNRADPVVHFEIASKDGKASQEFYSKLFGWKVNADNPMNYGVVETGSDQGIGGGIFQTDENMKPHVTVYVEVDDPDAYLKKIEKMGGKTIVPVTVVPAW